MGNCTGSQDHFNTRRHIKPGLIFKCDHGEKGTIPKSIVLTAAVRVLCILRCLAEDFIKKKKEEKITKENEKRREN